MKLQIYRVPDVCVISEVIEGQELIFGEFHTVLEVDESVGRSWLSAQDLWDATVQQVDLHRKAAK